MLWKTTSLLFRFSRDCVFDGESDFKDLFEEHSEATRKMKDFCLGHTTAGCALTRDDIRNVVKNCYALRMEIFKHWIRFKVPVHQCSRTISVISRQCEIEVRTPSDIIRISPEDYEELVKCLISSIVVTTNRYSEGPPLTIGRELVLVLCILAFQCTMLPEYISTTKRYIRKSFTHREYIDVFMVYNFKSFGHILDILESEFPAEYFRFSFFMNEFPRFPLYSMASKYYDLQFSNVSIKMLSIAYRPGSRLYQKLKMLFEDGYATTKKSS